MRITALGVTTILATLLHPAPSPAGAPEVYEQLRSLVGDWDADLPGFGKLSSTVRLVANGKALEETIGTPADNELSLYTLNGDTLLLTHYCAMTPDGHQVRLQTARIESAPARLDFLFVGATNLHSAAAPHMRRVTMTLTDQDHYSERWIKTEKGKDVVFQLNFVRRPG